MVASPEREVEDVPADGLDRPGGLLAWVAEELGMRVDGSRGRDLASALRPAQAALERSARGPLSRALAVDGALRDRVIAAATITETQFMRSPSQLGLLAAWLLPELQARRRAAASFALKIWSAGCASGEEAYSLAMLLLESVRPASAWNLEVLGTDINGEALARAERGVYGRRSVAGLSPAHRERYFERRGDSGLAVGPELRRVVHFARRNVLEAPPSGPFDVIVCRNLLIYLHPEAVAAALEGFAKALASDGFLLLGDADLPVLHSGRWRRARLGDSAYHCLTVEDRKR